MGVAMLLASAGAGAECRLPDRLEVQDDGQRLLVRTLPWTSPLSGTVQVEQRLRQLQDDRYVYRLAAQSEATRGFHQSLCAQLGMLPSPDELVLSEPDVEGAFACRTRDAGALPLGAPGAAGNEAAAGSAEVLRDLVFTWRGQAVARCGARPVGLVVHATIGSAGWGVGACGVRPRVFHLLDPDCASLHPGYVRVRAPASVL